MIRDACWCHQIDGAPPRFSCSATPKLLRLRTPGAAHGQIGPAQSPCVQLGAVAGASSTVAQRAFLKKHLPDSLHAMSLPNARDQPESNTRRVFGVTRELRIECPILECRADHNPDYRQYCRDKRPRRREQQRGRTGELARPPMNAVRRRRRRGDRCGLPAFKDRTAI